jgi:hypothetical protein
MQTRLLVSVGLFLLAGCLLCVAPAFSQPSQDSGKLKVHVEPKQAYVFVDGKAVRDGSQTITLPAGQHHVSVENYGYQPKSQSVEIDAHKTAHLDIALQPTGDKVAGPFAEVEFKGDPRAAVLLTGKTPAYFVGHVDEFDWDWIWHQRLLLKPGTYQVTVTREGNTIWSGPITAKAGQHVTVYLDRNGQTKTQDWKAGLGMGPQPRFKVGIASATIPIAPVSAQLSAQNSGLSCGQSTALNWNATNAVDASISGLGKVATEGNRTVTPNHSMSYVLTAMGPGGKATRTVTINENTQPTATLALSQPEIRYHRVGDKVVEEGSATLNWSTSNANSATLEPLDTHSTSGSRTITPQVDQTRRGPVDENVTYTFTASNACGGSVTRTATLHVEGSIDPPPPLTLASLFYPTDFPTKKNPHVGLVASEKDALNELAKHFENYQQYDHQARLLIVAHADVRASRAYNQTLSERRAELIQDYLISQGVSSDKIQTRAVGKDQQLDMKKVEALQSQDPEKPEKWETRHLRTTWLAYNRRADVILQPEGESAKVAYPNDVADVRILWEQSKPNLHAVMSASAAPAGTERASLRGASH